MALAARALALVRGRNYALPEDVQSLAPDVLRHRLVLSYEALGDNVTPDDVVTGDPRPPSRRPRSSSATRAYLHDHRRWMPPPR